MKSAVTHYTRTRNGKTERVSRHNRTVHRSSGRRGTKPIGWTEESMPGIKLIAGTAGSALVVVLGVVLEMTIGLAQSIVVVCSVAAVILGVLLGTKRGKKLVRKTKRRAAKRVKAKLYPKTRFSQSGRKKIAARPRR